MSFKCIYPSSLILQDSHCAWYSYSSYSISYLGRCNSWEYAKSCSKWHWNHRPTGAVTFQQWNSWSKFKKSFYILSCHNPYKVREWFSFPLSKRNRDYKPIPSCHVLQPIVDVFSFLAIATSYIGFVLGLSDFVADCKYFPSLLLVLLIVWYWHCHYQVLFEIKQNYTIQEHTDCITDYIFLFPFLLFSLFLLSGKFAVLRLPSGQSKPLPYVLTLLPPLVLALLDPEIFFKALDFAGTYGGTLSRVVMLFHTFWP